MGNLFSHKTTSLLQDAGILPVVCIKSQNELDTFMEALLPSSIRCIEITLRHPFAPKAISYVKNNFPEFIVGAGTVITEELLNCAIDNGADFCVSPGFDPKVVDLAFGRNIPFLPGCSTPSEILHAMLSGFKILKYFPAECSGGVNALNLYESVFADVTFIPTGGITKDNYLNYLNCRNVLACGGSFMIPKEMLSAGNSKEIYRTLTNYLRNIKENKK